MNDDDGKGGEDDVDDDGQGCKEVNALEKGSEEEEKRIFYGLLPYRGRGGQRR